MNETLGICKALAGGENGRVMTPYSFTIEEIMEMDEYHKQGKVHPLDLKYPSLPELQQRAGRYGKMAVTYLRDNNFTKYMIMRSHQTLWFKAVELAEQIEQFANDMMAAYEAPKGTDFFEKARARRAYQNLIEERIFEEYIKPFAADDTDDSNDG